MTGRGGGFTVTDTSTGGLFVDDAAQPLGPGTRRRCATACGSASATTSCGWSSRASAAAGAAAPSAPAAAGSDPASTPTTSSPRPESSRRARRPRDLPDPSSGRGFVPAVDSRRRSGAGRRVFDDPFTLDPGDVRPAPRASAPAGFDWDNAGCRAPAPTAAAAGVARRRRARLRLGPARAAGARRRRRPSRSTASAALAAAAQAPAADAAAAAAFLRGLGLDAADAPPAIPRARMEAFGREYRLMAEGLMQLLRMRAEEKGNARIAQTVVGAAEVNPLKFMPTVEDALAVMLAPRSGGFADADAAIAGAVRDLAAHHVGAWRGTQAALRRMVDRFDPATLEKELEALGLLETLLAGGRRAKLWELYQKRFREIAQSAETRFLGEVGADFRDAYEEEE